MVLFKIQLLQESIFISTKWQQQSLHSSFFALFIKREWYTRHVYRDICWCHLIDTVCVTFLHTMHDVEFFFSFFFWDAFKDPGLCVMVVFQSTVDKIFFETQAAWNSGNTTKKGVLNKIFSLESCKRKIHWLTVSVCLAAETFEQLPLPVF